MLTIKVFGELEEYLNTNTLQIEYCSNVGELKSVLLNKYPELSKHTFKIAVNLVMVDNNHCLNLDDEVALLPPFSGG